MYLVSLKYYLVYYLTNITTDNEEWERGYGKITALLFFPGDISVVDEYFTEFDELEFTD